MKIYRYHYEASNMYEASGFLTRINEMLDDATDTEWSDLFSLISIFGDKLIAPDSKIYQDNPSARSWFTEKGNRKFRKAISEIRRYMSDEYGYTLITETKEISSDDPGIIYSDSLQIVLK